MQRIVIMGGPGSGKSTFARRFAQATGLELIHLDQQFHLPGWVERDKGQWAARHAELIAGKEWIIDGCYSATAGERIKRADMIIWFDLPTHICLFRVLKRTIMNFGRVRPDSATGCPERFDLEFLLYVLTFRRKKHTRLMRIIATRDKNTSLVIVRRNSDLEKLFRTVQEPHKPGY